jgi:hypothetical protein
MAEEDHHPTGVRRSSRQKKPVQSFESTAYAVDILYTHLRNADTLEDFMSTLFMFYRPACHQPARFTSRGEIGGVFRMVSKRCAAVGLDPKKMMEFAHDYCNGDLDVPALRSVLGASSWDPQGIDEFEATIGISAETAVEGESDDEDEYKGGEEGEEDDEEDEDEDEEESGSESDMDVEEEDDDEDDEDEDEEE